MHGHQSELIADQLRADPRIAQAEQLLLAALADAQQTIDGPRPPLAALKESFQEQLDRLAVARGGALLLSLSRQWRWTGAVGRTGGR